MNLTFSCPKCFKPLEYQPELRQPIICPHCRSEVVPPTVREALPPEDSPKRSKPAINRWSLHEATALAESAESVWKAAILAGVVGILGLILACALGMSTLLFVLGGAAVLLGCWLGTMSQLLHIRATNLRLLEQTNK